MAAHVRTTRGRLGLAAVACVAASSAQAQPVSTANSQPAPVSQEQFLQLMGRLDALEKRNGELEAQVQALKSNAPPAAKPQPAEARATLRDSRPTLATRDGDFTASIRGMIQLDAANYDQRPPGPLATDFRRGSYGDATEADRARDLADGANFRRVRLGIEGTAWTDWRYNLLFDFGGTGVEEAGKIINAYVEYGGLGRVKLRAGAFAPVTGLEDATSNTASLFVERSAIAELVRNFAAGDGRTGAAAFANGDRWTAFGAVTVNTVGVQTFDEQLGFVGRLTFLPYSSKDGVVHLGVNANIIAEPAGTGPDVPPGAATPVRLRERPEMRVDGTRLVDTGNLDADGLQSYGLEFLGRWRGFSLQSEHFWIDVDRRNSPLADPSFSGWYVQAAQTLLGPPRRYSTSAGGFDSQLVDKPFSLRAGTWGVVELAARWSELDLNYRAGPAGSLPTVDSVRGGEQQILTLGLNWYPNNNIRFLADFQRVDVDRLSPGGTAFGAGALTPPAGAQVGQQFNIWSLRTQYAF